MMAWVADILFERFCPVIDVCVGFRHNRALSIVISEGIPQQIPVLLTLGLALPDAIHPLMAFLGFSAALCRFLLAGTDTARSDAFLVKQASNNNLLRPAALSTVEQSVRWVKILVLADLNQTVSPSSTL